MIYWVGNTIHDNVAHLCTSRGTFLRINGKTTLSPLESVAGGAPAVNHKATAIWLALRILAGNEHCNVCDGNMVSEYIFNFFMATCEWLHPKYVCRICNHLFCIHAKFYKHISPSYYKPDAQSLKFYWRCSYWIFSQFSIQGFHNLLVDWTQPLLVISL